MNRFYYILNIGLFFILITAFSGCQNIVSPQNYNSNKILQSESKWLTNIATKEKDSKVLYKEYDKNGKILKDEEFSDLGTIETRSSYTYVASQSLEEVVQFSDNGSILNTNKNEYTYDLNGRVVKKVSYESTGSIKSVFTFNYDSNGNLIQKIEVNTQSGNSAQTDINYRYNNSGELVSRTTVFEGATQSHDSLVYSPVNHTLDIINLNDTGNINTINTYKYNNQGRIIEEYSKDSKGNITKRYIYEYTYFD